MENIALIVTDLVADSDPEAMKDSARAFKQMNLAAASDQHCVSYLKDEDETPEIVHPGFATLYISFSIWNDPGALEHFRGNYSEDDHVAAQWRISNGRLPSLNEAFGRIWASRSLSAQALAALTPAILEGFGRRWLLDNIGNIADAFAYNHWEGRGIHDALSGTASKNDVSFFKRPFGSLPNPAPADSADDPSAQVEKKIKEFEQQFSGYNSGLDNQLSIYQTMDYLKLATLVDWAQNAIDWLNRQSTAAYEFAQKGYPQFSEKIATEQRRWSEAQELFVARRNAQYDHEVQLAYAKTGVDEDIRKGREERADINRQTNEDLLAIHREIMENRSRTFREQNKRWERAFYDKPAKYIMVEVDD